jgi:hypothetical protein
MTLLRLWLRRVGVWLGALLVLSAGAWTFWNFTASRALERALERLAAAGLPTSPAQVRPAEARPQDNAAPLYRAAFALLDALPEASADVDLDLAKLPQLPEETHRAVESASDALDLLGRAAGLPRCVHPLKYEMGIRMEVPHLLPIRKLSRLLAARAVVRAEAGNFDGAVSDLHALFAMARSLREEPVLVDQLVRFEVDRIGLRAVEVLLPRLESPVRDLDRVRSDAPRGAVAFAQRGEIVLIALRALDQDVLEDLDSVLGSSQEAGLLRLGWLARPYLKSDMARLLDLFRSFAQIAVRPYREAIPAWNAAAQEAVLQGGVLVRLYCSNTSHVLHDEARIVAQAELARAAALCLEHRKKRGAFPQTLDELETKAPEDPMAGKPFQLRREGGEVVLSSAADAEVTWRLPDVK